MKLTDQSGFTIAELMVSAMLSVMVLGAVYGVFRAQSHTVKGQESRMEAQEYGLSSVDIMVREIRNAGYFPTTTACTNVANNAGVASATNTTFAFVYDKDGDGNCVGDDEVITYAFDATGCAAGLGNITRNGTSLTDCNVTTAFQFTYFPQQTGASAPAAICTSGTPPACSASERATIQKVVISVTVQAKSSDTQFGGQSTLTTSATADLRNHGLPS